MRVRHSTIKGMNTEPIHSFLASLADRRKALGIPWDALGTRSGASRATLFRLLKDRQTAASFQTVAAVAEALGVHFEIAGDSIRARPIDAKKFLEEQAERQARKLVGMVQGTMGLEGQALAAKETAPLIKEMKRRLLAGPKRKLWYD